MTDQADQRAIEIAVEPGPGRHARALGAHHAVDPEQRDAAQDEGHHRGGEVRALGKAAGRDGAAIGGLGDGIDQSVAADRIDDPCPQLLLQGLARVRQLVAVDEFAGAQLGEVLLLALIAIGCDHGIARLGEQRGGHRADAAGRAGDEDLAVLGLDPGLDQRIDAERGGVARRADGHGFLAGKARRQLDQPVAIEPRLGGQPAPVHFADAPAIEQHRVSGLEFAAGALAHRADQIDPRHHRPAAHHRARASDGEAVLVVDRRVLHVDGDIAFGQLALVELLELAGLTAFGLLDKDGGEHGYFLLIAGRFRGHGNGASARLPASKMVRPGQAPPGLARAAGQCPERLRHASNRTATGAMFHAQAGGPGLSARRRRWHGRPPRPATGTCPPG